MMGLSCRRQHQHPCGLITGWRNSLRESSLAGFAFTCVMHRERSAMKEALTLLRECIDDDAVKISPMKMPCKAFAFKFYRRRRRKTGSSKQQQFRNRSTEVMKKVVRVAMRRQNVRFLERMIAISTTCEHNEDAIERAIDRLGIGNHSQNTFKNARDMPPHIVLQSAPFDR